MALLRIETPSSPTAGSRPFARAGQPDRDPRPAPSSGSTPFGPPTAGSRPFTPDGADRHPSPAHCRIETLHAGQRGKTPFPYTGRPDGDPSHAPGRPDRHPSAHHCRIETLHTGLRRKTPLPCTRTPGSRPLTGSTRWIDTLRPATAGSRPFTPDCAERHPCHAPDARIETPDRLHTADRHPSAHHCRIETLHAGWRGKTPFPCTRTPGSRPLTGSIQRIDTLRPTHCRIETVHTGRRRSTPLARPLSDRDPSRRTARKDTLPMRRTPGSRPLTGSTRRIDTLPPTTAGSRPFTPDGAERHPSHAPDARIETSDRLHTADRHPSAHHRRIETLHTGWRGKTPFPCAGRPDRDP